METLTWVPSNAFKIYDFYSCWSQSQIKTLKTCPIHFPARGETHPSLSPFVSISLVFITSLFSHFSGVNSDSIVFIPRGKRNTCCIFKGLWSVWVPWLVGVGPTSPIIPTMTADTRHQDHERQYPYRRFVSSSETTALKGGWWWWWGTSTQEATLLALVRKRIGCRLQICDCICVCLSAANRAVTRNRLR